MKKTIALTGGGSGGHIFPLVSLYNYLQEDNNYTFLWVGEEGGLEEEIAEKNNIEFHDIAAGKIRRYFDLRNFYEPLKNLTGIFEGLYYIWKYKIDIVFSKGGFVSFPLCIAAWIMRKKIYIHDSDIKTGLANKMISKIATKSFYTFPKNITKENKRHIVTGQIVNQELLEGLLDTKIISNKRLKVLVIAGSQGSTIIFKNLLKIIPDMEFIDFEIILGQKNKDFRKQFTKFSNVKVHDFVDQKTLGQIYKNTDIAITRGSATILWELYYFGIHSIIIPITHAGDHQIHNADFFNKNYGSDILDESTNLSLEIFRKLKKYGDLRKKGLNLEGFFDALKKIEKEI